MTSDRVRELSSVTELAGIETTNVSVGTESARELRVAELARVVAGVGEGAVVCAAELLE